MTLHSSLTVSSISTGHFFADVVTFSSLTGSTITASTLDTLQNTFSSMIMSPATYSSPTEYLHNPDPSAPSTASILIKIGELIWKIPIERVG
jgi:hypothetical protein